MSDTPNFEHKFDTLSLLEGLTEADTARFDLEDILREFGGPEVPAEEKKAAKEQELVDQIQQAIDHEMEMAPAEPAPVITIETPEPDPEPEPLVSEADALLRKHGFRLVRRETPLPEAPEESPDTDKEENAAGNGQPSLQIRIRDVSSLKEQQPEDGEDEDDAPSLPAGEVPSVEALYHRVNRNAGSGRRRMLLSFLLVLVSLFWTLAALKGWIQKPVFADSQKAAWVLAGITLLSAALAYETLFRGFRELFALQLRFSGAYALLLVLTVACAFSCTSPQLLPPCCSVCAVSFFALWGDTLHNLGLRRSLRPLLKEDLNPSSATVMTQALEGRRTVTRGICSPEEHVRSLLSENHMQKQMDSYAAAALILSVAGAVILKARLDATVLWTWTILLSVLLPMAGFIGYERPFAALSLALMKKDAAISGWAGASVLRDADSVLMLDTDLFPGDQIKLGGVKLYGNMDMNRASAYIAAAVEAAECGFAPVFTELRENNNGRRLTVTQFRRYEGGGIGAEITGEVILIGSRRFMTLMGIPMESDADIQNAVYMSVNGKLSALFVLHYKTYGKVYRAIHRLQKQTGMQLVIGSRDFMITPKLLEELFKVTAQDFLFPATSERDSLAALSGRTDGVQSAILPNDSFDSLTDVTIYAKKLGSMTRISALLCMGLSVIFSVVLTIMFLRESAVTAITVFLFSLLGMLPVLLITGPGMLLPEEPEPKQDTKKHSAGKSSNRMEKPDPKKQPARKPTAHKKATGTKASGTKIQTKKPAVQKSQPKKTQSAKPHSKKS